MLLDLKYLLSHLPPNVDKRDAFLLIQYTLKINYEKLFFIKEIEITVQEFDKLMECIQLRSEHMPIAKIIGHKSFYNNEFKTTTDTLDPRPETELIIDLFLKYFPNRAVPLSILDLGCGTGCIGLSILDFYKNSTLCLADISDKALSVAKYNAKNLNLENRCSFTKTSWFNDVKGKFNAIVCNPPYVEDNYDLDRDTLYDPPIALFGGKDGLDAYKKILPYTKQFLCDKGFLFLEIGLGQSEAVCRIAEDLDTIEIAKDLQGINRIIVFSINSI